MQLHTTDTPPAKIIIIGGGIIGVSIAAHLAQRGIIENVFLLEKDEDVARGETAASAAMLFFNTGNLNLVQLAGAALKEYKHLEEKFGIIAEFVPCGSLSVTTMDEGVEKMKRQARAQNDKEITSQFLTAKEIREKFPSLKGNDIKAGIYARYDGYVDQVRLTRQLRNYAQARGIHILPRTRVIEIKKNDERGLVSVHTNSRDSIAAEKIIIAAGGPSRELVTSLGYQLPLFYSTRALYTGNTESNLFTPIIEFVDGQDKDFYIRPAGIRHFMVGVGPTNDSYETPESHIKSFGEELTKDFLIRRFPALALKDLNGTAGARSMTPDGLPYFGPLDKEGKINVAYGLSGYGITFSPFIGRSMADLIVEGRINKEMEACLVTPERLIKQGGIEAK